RTGRAGKTGIAITLTTPRERRQLRSIEIATGQRIEKRGVPTLQEIEERERQMLGESLAEIIEQEDLEMSMMIVDELAAYYDPSEVAAAAIRLLMREHGSEDQEEALATTSAAEAGMTRLYLDLGRNDGVRPMDVVGAIANEARIPGKSIGQIDISDRYTLVDVPKDFAERVVRSLSRARLRGKPVNVEYTQPRA